MNREYVIVDCIKNISESVMFSIVLSAVDSEDLWTFSVVHVFRIVVIFIQELVHDLIVVLFSCCVDFVELKGGFIVIAILNLRVFWTRRFLEVLAITLII